MPVYLGNKKGNIYIGSTKIQKVCLGTRKVYPCGNTVTYCVDTGVTYQEEIDEGASCLSPSSFSPAKSGWTFVGWRQDTTASNEVINSLVMAESLITLYAVFQQTITLSYDGNGNTGGSTDAQTGIRYYNNENVSNPSFTLRQNGFSRNEYNFSKWTMGSTEGTQYDAGASVSLSASTTFYAVWASAVTISKSLEFNLGVDTAISEAIVANCTHRCLDEHYRYEKDRVVLFTAPRNCTLSGTLTLTVSGDAEIGNIIVVVHKNAPLGTQNGQIWEDVVTDTTWNEYLQLKNGSKSKTFSVSMEAGQMLLIWRLDQIPNDDDEEEIPNTGMITLSLSGSYQ